MIKQLKPKYGHERFLLRYEREITKDEKEFLDKVCKYFDANDEWDFISFAIASLAIRAQDEMENPPEKDESGEPVTVPLDVLDFDVSPNDMFM